MEHGIDALNVWRQCVGLADVGVDKGQGEISRRPAVKQHEIVACA